jgi:nucleotide sugar dehydrogenase
VVILKVCVIGLGEVGLPTASYIFEKGYKTWGYDISRTRVNEAKHKGIRATTNWNEIRQDDIKVYVICVATGIDASSKPDMSAVFDVCRKIASNKNNKLLVSIESTVAIGTCRKIYNNIFNKSINLVHVPHRYWKEDPSKHGVRQLRVIGGIDKESLEIGLDFYQQLNIPLYPVSLIEIAEASKVVENSYRFLQIAFAEELKMICDEHKIDINELRKACNTKWNIGILEARDGILGHCLPKDIRYLISFSRHNELLKSAISVDKKYRNYLRSMHEA